MPRNRAWPLALLLSGLPELAAAGTSALAPQGLPAEALAAPGPSPMEDAPLASIGGTLELTAGALELPALSPAAAPPVLPEAAPPIAASPLTTVGQAEQASAVGRAARDEAREVSQFANAADQPLKGIQEASPAEAASAAEESFAALVAHPSEVTISGRKRPESAALAPASNDINDAPDAGLEVPGNVRTHEESTPQSPEVLAAIGEASQDLASVVRFLLTNFAGGHINLDAFSKSAVAAMAVLLEDPYTRYMPPEQVEAEARKLNPGGIGASVKAKRKGRPLVVKSVEPGSPAEQAGLKPGDSILEVNDRKVSAMNEREAVSAIVGEPETDVRLLVRRASRRAKPVSVVLKRASLIAHDIFSRWVAPGVAYLRFEAFERGMEGEVLRLLREQRAQGARALVLDLRYNPGGRLETAVAIASLFLRKGQAVGHYLSRTERRSWTVESDGEFSDLPLVVLVNEHTASGGEFLAAALQEHGRSPVVGRSETTGKGSGQVTATIPMGGALRLTIIRWLTPNGRSVSKDARGRGGVVPDVRVSVSEKDELRGIRDTHRGGDPSQDPVLARALELLAPSLTAAGQAIAAPRDPAFQLPIPSPLTTAGQAVAAPADGGPLVLTRVVEARLTASKENPKMKRYLELLGELRKSYGVDPLWKAELMRMQRALADEVGVALNEVSGLLAVSPEGEHWLNRWVGGLRSSMGLLLLWSPVSNHFSGNGASYNSQGWIWGDDLGPLLSAPSSELFHEFLHAYFDRGSLAKKFAPLRTSFHNMVGWDGFPKAKESYPKASYAHSDTFRADELLTNLHTVYDRARKITALYGKKEPAWVSSAPESAPKEVQVLLDSIDTPAFLSASELEMASSLLPGVSKLAREGLQGRFLEKDYGRFDGALTVGGEIEAKQFAWYAYPWKERSKNIDVRYFSMDTLLRKNKDEKSFPVLFGNGRGSYFIRQELHLPAVAQANLDDPEDQDILVREAAEALAPKLRELKRLNEVLAPSMKRLRELQARGRERVDLELVREIREAAYAAFLQGVRFFTRQPDVAPIGLGSRR